MLESTSFARIVLTTVSNTEEAKRLGRALVEEGLVACATAMPAVDSIYRWKGQVESAAEVLLLLKTGRDQLTALERRLEQLHSYETPEFLVLEVAAGSHAYLEWMLSGLSRGSEVKLE